MLGVCLHVALRCHKCQGENRTETGFPIRKDVMVPRVEINFVSDFEVLLGESSQESLYSTLAEEGGVGLVVGRDMEAIARDGGQAL